MAGKRLFYAVVWIIASFQTGLAKDTDCLAGFFFNSTANATGAADCQPCPTGTLGVAGGGPCFNCTDLPRTECRGVDGCARGYNLSSLCTQCSSSPTHSYHRSATLSSCKPCPPSGEAAGTIAGVAALLVAVTLAIFVLAGGTPAIVESVCITAMFVQEFTGRPPSLSSSSLPALLYYLTTTPLLLQKLCAFP